MLRLESAYRGGGTPHAPDSVGKSSLANKLSRCRAGDTQYDRRILILRDCPSRRLCRSYRLSIFFSIDSVAASFRSLCCSVRRAPECSSQGSAVAAPQVGQGTDKISCRVSSLVFIATGYTSCHSQKRSIKLIFQHIREAASPASHFPVLSKSEQFR